MSKDTLWVEKHRPHTLDQIIGHDAVVERMKKFVTDSAMPNLLFAGRQGIGKTAIIQAFAREKYGEGWRNNVLELNASDARGIDVVRDDIKQFARQSTADGADFKLVFLDEADNLTRDAQPALRRIMEDYDDRTRFVLSCNYPNQIIDPLQSRCAVFRLSPLSDTDIKHVLERVVSGEGVDAEEDALVELVAASGGDARTAINTLQACVLDGSVSATGVQNVLTSVDDAAVEAVVETAFNGDLEEAFDALDSKLLGEGAGAEQILDVAIRVVQRTELPEDAKMKAIDVIGEADWRVRRGGNPHIQLHWMLAGLMLAKHSSFGHY